MHKEVTFVLWLLGLGSIGMALVVYGTIAKNRWGINLDPLSACPSCGAKLPIARKPTSLHQALWGGNTCSACGKEWDKWGRIMVKPQI
jgi:DNA-directed RNA polymerase subunit RPC12/RpoP